MDFKWISFWRTELLQNPTGWDFCIPGRTKHPYAEEHPRPGRTQCTLPGAVPAAQTPTRDAPGHMSVLFSWEWRWLCAGQGQHTGDRGSSTLASHPSHPARTTRGCSSRSPHPAGPICVPHCRVSGLGSSAQPASPKPCDSTAGISLARVQEARQGRGSTTKGPLFLLPGPSPAVAPPRWGHLSTEKPPVESWERSRQDAAPGIQQGPVPIPARLPPSVPLSRSRGAESCAKHCMCSIFSL